MATRPKNRRDPRRISAMIRAEFPSLGLRVTPHPRSRPLPALVWARLFALAVDRLALVKPEWAALTAREFLEFQLSWRMAAPIGTPQQEEFLEGIFDELEGVRFVGRGRI